jgi:hypothetical protein
MISFLVPGLAIIKALGPNKGLCESSRFNMRGSEAKDY